MSITVIATGGTIASLADPETGAVRPAVSADDLVATVPGLGRDAPIEVVEVAQVNGWNVTPEVMLEVARQAHRSLAADGTDGVVVTHGTDTVEETAFFCDLTVASPKPVVFAAAMRNGSEIAPDGPRNLLNAATIAADRSVRGTGALITLNDEIHAARWARKQDSYRVSAFRSPGHGPVGLVRPEGLDLAWRPAGRLVLDLPETLPAVAIVQTYTGIEPGLIGAVVGATGAEALVLEGTGLGNIPGSAEAEIAGLVGDGMPVIITSRVPTGGTQAVYGGPGGGVTLRELGVIPGGELSAAKARLLAMLLLAAGEDLAGGFARARRLLGGGAAPAPSAG